MIPRLSEEDAVVGDAIDEAMFLGDASGPDAGAEVPERLWFAKTNEGIPTDGFDEFENFEGRFAICRDPVGEIFEKITVEH